MPHNLKSKKKLGNILYKHFIKYSLIPIFVVEIALIILYFSINAYISSKNINLLLDEVQSHSQDVLENEATIINNKLVEISRTAESLQYSHENIMSNLKQIPISNFKAKFSVAPNGVFYKTNHDGASLYYSSQTKIEENQIQKASATEAMDISLKSAVEVNPNINAAYFNTWDDMNRLYPFIDKVYEQYGEHIRMEDYNFYYLADLKHNPLRKPVWTSAYLDPAGSGWMLSCVVPIYNKDFLEGVTGLDITIDNFIRNILDKRLPYNASLFMIDKDGMIIAMPEEIESLLGLKELKEHLYTDSILKTIAKPEEYNILTNKSPFSTHFKNLMENKANNSILKINDKEYLTLQQSIAETDWKLIVLIKKDNIFSSIGYLKDLSDKIGYAAIALLLLFYVLFFYFLLKRINIFSEYITRPITDLSNQTSKISYDNPHIEVLESNIIEVHQLSSNFSFMIKELNERSKKLSDAKIKAVEANRIKSDFLSNMSHELRTPLNGVIGMSQIALDNETNKKQRSYLEKINTSGSILLKIINDLLDYSKIEAGKLEIENIEFTIDNILQNVADLVSIKAYEKDIEIVFNRDINIPKIIIGDSLRITQILVNIISNAVKFTNKGEVLLEIKIKDIDEKKINLEFLIKDSGIGMSEETLGNLFTSFNQADNTISRKYGGTGLGLAISKNLLELMGGDISVSSKINQGSTFILNIPFEYIESKENINYNLTKDIEIKLFDLSSPILNNIKDVLKLFKIKYEEVSTVDFKVLEDIKYIILTENENIKSDLATLIIINPNKMLIDLPENVKVISKPINPSLIYNSILELIDINTEFVDKILENKTKTCEHVNVLLVEDNPTNQLIAKLFLESFGCNVELVDNGLKAVNYLKNEQHNIDIVFMDIQMPIMDGYEATGIIRDELNLSIPIVAMTANAMPEDVKKTKEMGMNKHIGKPINKSEIEKAILTFVKFIRFD